MRYDFKREYVGPNGPHLNCLTNFTRTRDHEKRTGSSIHPRVVNGRTVHAKKNTAKPPKAA